jgi:hypothetical protein
MHIIAIAHRREACSDSTAAGSLAAKPGKPARYVVLTGVHAQGV